MEKAQRLTEGDTIHICKRAMGILSERGLQHDVEDRTKPSDINEVFAAYNLPYQIRMCGHDHYDLVDLPDKRDWLVLL